MISVAKPRSDTLPKMTAPQIADDLADRIRRKDIRPGEQLNFDALAEHYDVRRWTIKRAVALLRYAGLVEDQPGRGVFVKEVHPPG